MKQFCYILLACLLGSALSSCTNARWMVQNKSAVDKTDYEILQQHQFLKTSGDVSPEHPVLRLDVLSRTKYEYAEKVLMQRNIQDYRLRPGFVAMGLTGAAMAFYVAQSSDLRGNGTSVKSMTLNAAGALLAISGFLNMKAVGEPRPTGEQRFLRKTGSFVSIDTIRTKRPASNSATVRMAYNGKQIFEDTNLLLSGSHLEIPLADKLSNLRISGSNPGSVSIYVSYLDSSYTFKYPVEQILQPYARVTSQFAELRNSPRITPSNILADLLKGSQVKVQDYSGHQWYRVLYGGITENYILKEDADLVWEATDLATDNQVVTVPRIPFGNIDVESNIPILQNENPNAVALIVTNENYSHNLPENSYAHRDGKLIQTYLQNALGFNPQRVFVLHDLNSRGALYDTLSHIRFSATDSTRFFVYLNGYGSVKQGDEKTTLTLLTPGNGVEEIDLSELLSRIASVPSHRTFIASDIDFSHKIEPNALDFNEQQQVLETLASEIRDSKTTLLMSAQPGQPSSLYFSTNEADKKHHIFPYFLARALQQRITKLPAIYQFLERNVSYMSRKLHDRPQDPLLMGNVMLNFVELNQQN